MIEELLKKKKFLELIFDGIQDGISVLDKDLHIIKVNKTMEEWYSHALPLSKKKCFQAYHGESKPCTICPSIRAIETGKTQIDVVPFTGKKGRIGWQELIAFPLKDEKDNVIGVIEYIRDVTECQRTEDALRQSKEQIQSILDNTTAVIYLKDTQGKYILTNRQHQHLFHITKEAIVGKTDYDIFPKEIADAFRANDQKVLKAQAPLEMEEVALHDDGPHTYISIKFPLFDSNGIPYGVCGISTDITERKRAEEELRSSRDYLQKLNDSLGAVILTIKIPERVIEYVNSTVESIFGYKPDECIGKKTKMFYLKVEEYHDFGRLLRRAIKEGRNELRVERLFKRKNGEIFPCEITITFLKENKKTVRVISILHDITERKKTEDLLQEQKKALERKNIALGEILGQIEIEKKQIKDNVIANAENLLLPIIQKLNLKGESRKYVQILQSNLQELTSSFGAKLTEERTKLTPREIEVCNMIKNGFSSKEIAGLLNITHGTANRHRNSIRRKLGIINKNVNLSSVLKSF